MTDRTSRTSETSSGMETAKEAVAAVTQQAKEATQQLSTSAREQGEQLKARAASAAQERKTEAAEIIGALATALHAAGDSLREQDQQRIGRMGDDLADQVDRMANYLRTNDIGGLMNDLEDLGRRNPAAFLGITFVGGLLAGRFLRASRPERRDSRTGSGSPRTQTEPERERPHPTFQEPGQISDAAGASFARPPAMGASDIDAARPGGPAIPDPRTAGPSEPWSPGIHRPPSAPFQGGE